MIEILPALSLPDDAVDLRFVRSRGPGGQNVNKVSTCALLSFDIARCSALSDSQRETLLQTLGTRLTRNNVLLLRSDSHRTASANRAAVLDRFARLLAAALTPRKPRRPSRPTRASRQRRLSTKARHSSIKQSRRRAHPDD